MARLLLLTAIVLIAATLLMALWRWLPHGLSRPRPDDTRRSAPTGLLLFLLPAPVALAAAITLARGQVTPFLGDAIGYGLFLTGALLVRRGLRADVATQLRLWPLRAAVALPLKTAGGAMIALATGITTWLGVGHHPVIAIAYAGVALLGCHLAYGLDLPQRQAHDARQEPGQAPDRHTRTTLAEAARTIGAIEQASRDIHQPELEGRLQRIAGLARAILALLEEDPRDVRRASKFLNVYLDGVQSVVSGYARTHDRVDAPALDERFRRALITIEDVFQEQQQTLLASDVDALDVQLEVLTEQLKREGII